MHPLNCTDTIRHRGGDAVNDDIDPSRSKDETASASLRAVSPLLVAGIQFAATVLICIAGGWWLDQRFQTSPWLLLAGGLFG